MPAPMWPGAVERGLEQMPDMAPEVIDLTGPEQQCWMNVIAWERKIGRPLTALELRRIYQGKHPLARHKRATGPGDEV